MPLNDRTPLVNGIAYSYVDINVLIGGVPLSGISAINYAENAEVANNYGAGRRPVSRGYGKIETEVTMTIDRAELNALIDAAPSKSLLNIPEFDMIVAYVPEGSIPKADTLKNCRFANSPSGGAVDDTSIDSELTLVVSHIEWNTLD